MPVQNIVRGVRRERNGVRMESENAIFKRNGRVLMVVNPCAGRTKGLLYADLLETRLKRAGVPVVRCETTAEENGAGYAAAAAVYEEQEPQRALPYRIVYRSDMYSAESVKLMFPLLH